MNMLLAFLLLLELFFEVLSLQTAPYQYNYQVSSDASDAITSASFAFTDDLECLLNKYQGIKAETCKMQLAVSTAIANTNTLLSEQLKSLIPKIQNADEQMGQGFSQCGQDPTCIYVKQLEDYFLVESTKENSLKSINNLKDRGLKEIKTLMDKCTE